jgi:membrane associated rhomboid family serine protease
MVGASGAISALFGLYALFYGQPKQVTAHRGLNRGIHVLWLLVTWVVLQWMAGVLAGGEGVMLATPAHIGGSSPDCCCSGRCCCGNIGRLSS